MLQSTLSFTQRVSFTGAVSTAAATGCPGGWRLLCGKTAVLSTAIKERLILYVCFFAISIVLLEFNFLCLENVWNLFINYGNEC